MGNYSATDQPPPDGSEGQQATIEPPEIVAHDPETDTYRASFDSRTESVPMAIVSTVAELSDSDPTELAPLSAVIDPDALDTVFQPGAAGHVVFAYHGYEIVVHSDGELEVTEDGG